MNELIAFLILSVLFSVVCIARLRLLAVKMSRYIEHAYPDDWQRFLSTRHDQASQNKWARVAAMEAVRSGQFNQVHDNEFVANKTQIKRAQLGLFISPFLAFLLSAFGYFFFV